MRIRPATMATPIKRCAPGFSVKDGSKPALSEEQEAYVVEHEFAALRINMGAIVGGGITIICNLLLHLHTIRMN